MSVPYSIGHTILLSDRPLVRTQPGVPKMTAVSRFLMVYSGFLLSFHWSVFAAPPERFNGLLGDLDQLLVNVELSKKISA